MAAKGVSTRRVEKEVVLAKRWARVRPAGPIIRQPNATRLRTGNQPQRPRGILPTRPSQKFLVGLALLLFPEGLGVESRVGRASDPRKNRQSNQGRYDRLHGPHS